PQVERAARDDVQARLDPERDALPIGRENDRVQATRPVLQGEVTVTAAHLPAADLPRHRDVAPRRAQAAAHLGEKLRDRVRAWRRGGRNRTGIHPAHDCIRGGSPDSVTPRENGRARRRRVAINTSLSPKLYSKRPATVTAATPRNAAAATRV